MGRLDFGIQCNWEGSHRRVTLQEMLLVGWRRCREEE